MRAAAVARLPHRRAARERRGPAEKPREERDGGITAFGQLLIISYSLLKNNSGFRKGAALLIHSGYVPKLFFVILDATDAMHIFFTSPNTFYISSI